jgi:phosphatidylglycerophosphatase A
VIDEFLGVCCLWFFLSSWPSYLLGFILFRLFDIFKPGPIGWLDRNLNNGFGVMLDDILSGLLSGIICRLIFIFL